jgi:sec-independent protein translocase protein TatA
MLNLNVLAFGMPGIEEWMVIAIIGVLVFGKRLPEVGKNLGKGIVEFKKGLKGIDEEVERASSMPTPPSPPVALPPVTVSSAPNPEHKFDPVTGQPLASQQAIPAGSKFDPFTGKPLVTEPVAAGGDAKEAGKWY